MSNNQTNHGPTDELIDKEDVILRAADALGVLTGWAAVINSDERVREKVDLINAGLTLALAELRANATQPPQDERGQGLSMDTMQAIYAKAWSRAADWANRHDLHSDIGSPAYLKDMAIELAEFADVAAAPPVALSTLTDELAISHILAAKEDSPAGKWLYDFAKAIERRATSAPAQQAESLRMEEDAVDALFEDGWIWDGDQWQRPSEPSTPPQPVVAEVTDARRLDWLLHKLRGAELRRIGIEKVSGGAYWVREAIDAAMAGTGSDESGENGNG